MPTHVIDSERRLRPYSEDDADELYALIDENRAMLARWMPWAPGQTLETTREFIRASQDEFAAGESFQLAVFEGGALVGGCGFHHREIANDSAFVGYWLARSAQGRGTMTLAMAGLIDWAFKGPWQLHRVALHAGRDNLASRAIAERLGFAVEGTLREAQWVDDRWLDLVVYGLLADDWSGVAAPSVTKGQP